MNLLAQLHARWAADSTLNGLLAATSVQTGEVYESDSDPPARPFALIHDAYRVPVDEWNDGAIDAVTVRVTVYHYMANRDELDAIADAVNACFSRQHFPLSGSDKVLSVKRAGQLPAQDDVGDWSMVMDFRVEVYLDSGV